MFSVCVRVCVSEWECLPFPVFTWQYMWISNMKHLFHCKMLTFSNAREKFNQTMANGNTIIKTNEDSVLNEIFFFIASNFILSLKKVQNGHLYLNQATLTPYTLFEMYLRYIYLNKFHFESFNFFFLLFCKPLGFHWSISFILELDLAYPTAGIEHHINNTDLHFTIKIVALATKAMLTDPKLAWFCRRCLLFDFFLDSSVIHLTSVSVPKMITKIVNS